MAKPLDTAVFQEVLDELLGKVPRSAAPPGLDVELRLELTRRAMRDGGTFEISVLRRVACDACGQSAYRGGGGCAACEQGFKLATEKLRVRVPAGVKEHQKLRLRGKGHATREGTIGDAYVQIVARPTWIERAHAKGYFGYAVLAALPLFVVGVYVARSIERSKLPQVGAPCARNEDCASNQCLALYDEGVALNVPGGGTFRGLPVRAGGVCTEECKRDEDCPSSMTCAGVEKRSTLQGMPDLGPSGPANAKACSPR